MNHRKLTLLLLAALTTTLPLFARPISEEKACAIATRFYYMKKMGDDIKKVKSLQALDLVYSSQHGEEIRLTPPEYYVFAPENRKGFVIVAGDDRARQLIAGYSLDAPISYKTPSIAGFLDCYTGYIEALRQGKTSSKAKRKADAVAPLIATQWGQHAPYNYYCPTYKEGKGLTGCVATAVAQIMKYYAWPTQAGNSTYRWAKMKKSYHTSAKTRITDVARLMRDVGDAVQMDYGRILSGANSGNVLTALAERFHYAPTMRYIHRSQYTDDTWHRIIADELKARRPIYYDSRSTVHDGHAFIVCGMDEEGLYYVNWGWSGVYDGYFDFEAVSHPGTSYNYIQNAIIGIEPDPKGKM